MPSHLSPGNLQKPESHLREGPSGAAWAPAAWNCFLFQVLASLPFSRRELRGVLGAGTIRLVLLRVLGQADPDPALP